MRITDKVIMDLLPLYFADEASEDTKTLVEFYFNEHPEFAKAMKKDLTTGLPRDIPTTLKPEDEMIILRKTKRLFKFRTFFLVIAIFCTALPFSFGDVSWSDIEGVHWLWSKYPESAIISGIVGLLSWISYFIMQYRLRITAV